MDAFTIDTEETVAQLVDDMIGAPNSPPSLYLICQSESWHNFRLGDISVLTIFIPEVNVYLVDILKLGVIAFTTPGATGETLKSVLESPEITKIFFDIRKQSYALFREFQINLAGVQDIQLMERGTRERVRREPVTRNHVRHYIAGRLIPELYRCIDKHCDMSAEERDTWFRMRGREVDGRDLGEPNLYLGYEALTALHHPMFFNNPLYEPYGGFESLCERPLTAAAKIYCTQDIPFIADLWAIYTSQLTAVWATRVAEETRARVTQTQSADYGARLANYRWRTYFNSPRHWNRWTNE